MEEHPMSIGLMARSLVESPTMRLNEEARKMRERGEPVIHLGIGEPKSPTPVDAIRSAMAKLSDANIHYTPTDGTPELKQAIIRYVDDNYGRQVAPDQVIASGGAKQSLSVILASILNPQDEVIIPAPYWVSSSHCSSGRRALSAAFFRDSGCGHLLYQSNYPEQPQ